MSRPRYVACNKQGSFAKLGGGLTNDIQEAQVLGWEKRKLAQKWLCYGYKLIPVEIVIEEIRE